MHANDALSVTDIGFPVPGGGLGWSGSANEIIFDEEGIGETLRDVRRPAWIIVQDGRAGLACGGEAAVGAPVRLAGWLPPLPAESLGDPDFKSTYRTRYAYYAGAMANGIASMDMLIALGKAGLMGSFGAAGLSPERIREAILAVQQALPDGPFAFNLIHSPNEPAAEQRAVDLYLQHGVRVVEASAYLDLTLPLAQYRLAGLSSDPQGRTVIGNRLIAKLSRKEVARRFMEPAPDDLIQQLFAQGKISEAQARLALTVPMADDVTVEADSGGHTDNRPLVGLVPAILALRDELQAQHRFAQPVRVGAGGGISTPAAALAAFMLGAAYVVTGSVNQACVESGACAHVKNLLAQADMADVIMAPAADMFEMGVKVQLLKRGTLFPLRAQKLHEIYTRYASLEEIPAADRARLESQVFRREIDAIWTDVFAFFRQRDPAQLERAERDPRQKMALVFRWYLGLSSRWAVNGEKGREMDYQIWCGPAMGVFNEWARGTYLEQSENRRVADVAMQLLTGAAYLYRVRMLTAQGVRVSPALEQYRPKPFPAAPARRADG